MTLSEEQLIKRSHETYPDNYVVDNQRYLSREWQQIENQFVWAKCWQLVCRASVVAEAGSYFEYTVPGGESVLIVRQEDGSLRGMSNICRHRGTMLKMGQGQSSELQCPYHGWRYTLDGALVDVPQAWDFALGPERKCLPTFRVDTFAGWVFLTLDPDAPALTDYLDPLPRSQFVDWRYEGFVRAFSVGIVCPANWKVMIEAFLEAYHAPWAHPQAAMLFNEVDAHYYGRIGTNVGHYRTIVGAASPNMAEPPSEQDIFDYFLDVAGRSDQKLDIGDRTAHEMMGGLYREMAAEMGIQTEKMTDEQLVDSYGYYIFPNIMMWTGLASLGLVYRVLPYGNDPSKSIFEINFLRAVNDETSYTQGHRPADVETTIYPEGTRWVDVVGEGMQSVGEIMDQDMHICMRVQRGVESAYFPGPILARSQESAVRVAHERFDELIGSKVDPKKCTSPERQTSSSPTSRQDG